MRPLAVTGFNKSFDAVTVSFSDGDSVEAGLLVAADGGRSALRERAGIPTYGWEYDQSGIVVTVAHERDHNGRAEEHFLPSGPFAILPLTGKRSSLVWTETRRDADRIVALPEDEFKRELEQRFGLHLGEVHAESRPRAFPLGYSVARSFVGERLALVGDAAQMASQRRLHLPPSVGPARLHWASARRDRRISRSRREAGRRLYHPAVRETHRVYSVRQV